MKQINRNNWIKDATVLFIKLRYKKRYWKYTKQANNKGMTERTQIEKWMFL